MFLSEEALNKYSIFGKFENHVKYTIFRQDNEDESKFEVLPFLNYCENDTKWYHTLMDVMIDKDAKLATLTQDAAKKQTPQLQHHPMPSTSTSIISHREETISPTKEIIKQKSKREPPISKEEQRKIDVMKNWYPLRFKLNYPKKSVLSAYEQKDFIDLFKRFQNRTHLSQKEVKLYKLYVHYRNLIEKERVAFYEYAKQYFQNASEDYAFVNDTIVQYIQEMITYLQHQPSKYSRYFNRIDEIAIDHAELNKASFEFEKSLVQLGNISKVILPSVNAQQNLIIAYTPISKRAPVGKAYKKLTKIPINEDPNAEKLALKYQADIVMTNSAFVHLIYHLSAQNEDDLKMPIIVKDLIDSTKKSVHKVVFIDKPFISKYLNQRDKNNKFYKRSLMVSLVKHQMMTRSNKKQQSNNQTINDSVDQFEHSFDERKELKPNEINIDYESQNKLESFGVYSETKKEELTETINKKRPIETPTKEIEELEAKKFKQSDPSPTILSKPNEKKLNEPLDNDYEEYDSDSESGGLEIVTDNNNSANISKFETPSSPINENSNIMEIISEPSPEEPEIPKYDQINIKPMVIPLEKLPDKQPEPKPTTSKQPSVLEVKKPTEETKESNLTLLDLISKMQEKLITASNTVSKTPVQHILSNLTPAPKLSQQQPAENIKDYTYIENIHENINYNLWIINGHKPIRILVRSSISGYVNTESSSRSSIVLHNKLEYQPQFGCEKLTHKDYCFMWSKSFIRNLCDVLLCRINVFTNKLISVKTLNHKDILTGSTTFNPQQSLNYLRSLFEKFNKYDAGEYLLNKEPNEKKITIMKSASMRTAFDLHQFYLGFQVEGAEKKPEWIPLDTDIYLPYHYQLHRVPCTFEPNDSKYSKNSQQNNKSKRRKSKSKSKQTP